MRVQVSLAVKFKVKQKSFHADGHQKNTVVGATRYWSSVNGQKVCQAAETVEDVHRYMLRMGAHICELTMLESCGCLSGYTDRCANYLAESFEAEFFRELRKGEGRSAPVVPTPQSAKDVGAPRAEDPPTSE